MVRLDWLPRMLLSGLVPILMSCGTLYLHSKADQQAMDGAVGGMTAAKQSQLAALAEHRTALQALIAQERTAVTVENLRLRDSLVIRVIDESKDWKSTTTNAIGQQLQLEIGDKALPRLVLAANSSASPSILFANFVEAHERAERQLPGAHRQISRDEEILEQRGGVIKQHCGATGQPPVIELPANDDAANTAADNLRNSCNDLQSIWNAFVAAYAPLSQQPPLIQCMMGDRSACETGGASSDVPAFVALEQALDVDTLIAANRDLAKAAQKHLAELETNYKCALADEAAGGAGSRVSEAAKLVTDFVAALPNSAAEVDAAVAASAPAATTAAATTPASTAPSDPDACPDAPPEALTFAGLLKKAGLSEKDLNQIISGLAKIEPGGTVVAALADSKAAFAQSRLAALLAASADPKATLEASRTATDPADRQAIAVAGFVALLDPVSRLVAAQQGALPDTRAVLVDLAMARYERALAQIELDRLTRSREAIHVRADATVHQLSALARASLHADAGRREQTILALVDAWNRGVVPAAAAGVELRGYRYAAWTAREEAATQANYATIEPLLAELQTYAAGGFTADEIARLISALGIVGIAVGVN